MRRENHSLIVTLKGYNKKKTSVQKNKKDQTDMETNFPDNI